MPFVIMLYLRVETWSLAVQFYYKIIYASMLKTHATRRLIQENIRDSHYG